MSSSNKITPQAPPSSKKRKSPPTTEHLDIPSQLGLATGTRLQVKWTITDDDDVPEEVAEAATKTIDNEPLLPKTTEVWWTATLKPRTSNIHTLTPEEQDEVDYDLLSNDKKQRSNSKVTIPIYELDYDPLPEMGFDERALEQVAFVSDRTLLNLNSEEVMIYRREGEASPPPSPVPDDEMEMEKHLNPEGLQDLMQSIMVSSLEKCGIRYNSLPMDRRQMMADRMRTMKDKLYERLMGEMERVGAGGGEKVITGEMVRRCVSEMGES